MTTEQIAEKHRKETIRFVTARKLRELLDVAAGEYGADWAEDDAETSILELVTEES